MNETNLACRSFVTAPLQPETSKFESRTIAKAGAQAWSISIFREANSAEKRVPEQFSEHFSTLEDEDNGSIHLLSRNFNPA